MLLRMTKKFWFVLGDFKTLSRLEIKTLNLWGQMDNLGFSTFSLHLSVLTFCIHLNFHSLSFYLATYIKQQWAAFQVNTFKPIKKTFRLICLSFASLRREVRAKTARKKLKHQAKLRGKKLSDEEFSLILFRIESNNLALEIPKIKEFKRRRWPRLFCLARS